EQLVRGLVYDFLGHNPCAANFAERLRHETGTRFVDWIDSIIVPNSSDLLKEMQELRVRKDRDRQRAVENVWPNAKASFPRIAFHDQPTTRVYLKVDSVADFVAANPSREKRQIEGEPLAPVRLCVIAKPGNTELAVIERHGYRAFDVPASDPARAIS